MAAWLPAAPPTSSRPLQPRSCSAWPLRCVQHLCRGGHPALVSPLGCSRTLCVPGAPSPWLVRSIMTVPPDDDSNHPAKRHRPGAADGGGSDGGGDIISATAEFVRGELSGNDASHDWDHIERVRHLAAGLAKQELASSSSPSSSDAAGSNTHAPATPAPDLEVVELAALLHDIADWKCVRLVSDGRGARRGEPGTRSLQPLLLLVPPPPPSRQSVPNGRSWRAWLVGVCAWRGGLGRVDEGPR
jgi:hypothetical protein